MKTLNSVISGILAGYIGVSSAFAGDDPNYPSQPPITEAVTIYGEKYPPLEAAADLGAYKTFIDNYPHSSKVLRVPVQVWPLPEAATSSVSDEPETVGKVFSNKEGWPMPSLKGYQRTGELGGVLCDVFGKGKELKAELYEKGDSQITTYSHRGKVVAYSTALVSEELDGVFFIDALTNKKFNAKSSGDTDLCKALELSALIRYIGRPVK